jgi:hypothetical protein
VNLKHWLVDTSFEHELNISLQQRHRIVMCWNCGQIVQLPKGFYTAKGRKTHRWYMIDDTMKNKCCEKSCYGHIPDCSRWEILIKYFGIANDFDVVEKP